MHIDGVLEEPGAGRAEEVVAESRDLRILAFATAGPVRYAPGISSPSSSGRPQDMTDVQPGGSWVAMKP